MRIQSCRINPGQAARTDEERAISTWKEWVEEDWVNSTDPANYLSSRIGRSPRNGDVPSAVEEGLAI